MEYKNIAEGRNTKFWGTLKEYCEKFGDYKKLLSAKSMEDFWYTKGYIQAMHDIIKYVETIYKREKTRRIYGKKENKTTAR